MIGTFICVCYDISLDPSAVLLLIWAKGTGIDRTSCPRQRSEMRGSALKGDSGVYICLPSADIKARVSRLWIA